MAQFASGMGKNIALITGVGRQDGSYLAEVLLKEQYRVHGIVRSHDRTENLDAVRDNADLQVWECDVRDTGTLRKLIQEVRPDELYDLAGKSHPGRSFEISELTHEQTGTARATLLRLRGKKCRKQNSSTSRVQRFSGMRPKFPSVRQRVRSMSVDLPAAPLLVKGISSLVRRRRCGH